MKKILLFAVACLAATPSLAQQQPNWLSGTYTVAPGPDNIQSNLPAAAYPYNTAWVTDRPCGNGVGVCPGFMVSNGTSWVSDQGVTGATGPAGANGTNGTNGTAATVSLGTVSTGVPGSNVIITNSGTSSAALFNFTIPRGDVGATGATGPAGPSGAASIGSPNSRSLSVATAYQATDNTKPAFVNINLTSTASLSLSGGTTNTASVFISSSSTVNTTGGSAVCTHGNSNTGALTIGLALSTVSTTPCSFALPAGWYMAIRTASGTVTVVSAFDQPIG